MHYITFVYLILSLAFASINAHTHYLDNLEILDPNTLPIDRNIYEPPSKEREKSYLEKLEEKTIYENELRKIELLAKENEQLRNNQGDQTDDDYLRFKSINVYPAFSYKELNDQPTNNNDDEDLLLFKAGNKIQQQPAFIDDLNKKINPFLTTMPTDLKNRLMSGPRLRRASKKNPLLIYEPVALNNNDNNPNNYNSEEEEGEDESLKIQNEQFNNQRLESEIEENLNKEIDLEQLNKYLMVKRNELAKDKNSESISAKSSNSGKESSDSKESKESNDSKESNETNEMNKKEALVPTNSTTESKKPIITEQDDKAFQKVETYKKSLELNKMKKAKNYYDQQLKDDLLFVNNQPSIDANYEKMIQHANLQDPIFIRERNSIENRGHLMQNSRNFNFSDLYFVGIVVACSMVSILSVIGAGYFFYRAQQHNKTTANVDYPAYGVIGPAFKSSQEDDNGSPKTKSNPITQESLVNKATNINHQPILSQDIANQNGSDRKLAQSAQMYHYHHQKQQMISTEKNKNCRNASSDVESDEENEETDYTVYECAGLASNLGEIEITNPNFQHENVTTPTTKDETK